MNCFYCGEEFTFEVKHEYTVIALDKVYVNLYVHTAKCLEEIEKQGIQEYISSSIDRILQQSSHSPQPKDTKVKRKT